MEFAQIFIWWLLMQLFGAIALPVAWRALRWLPDRGYTAAKALGLLLVSYTLWLGASVGFLQNDVSGALAAVLMVATLSAVVYWRTPPDDRPSLRRLWSQRRGLLLTSEVLFAVALVAWAVLRAYAPDKIMSAGGEKFMEIAFLNGILNSPSFPPLDPWLSGYAISYYYFGYVMMALMARLSGALPGVAFDLYDALLFALTATGAFGVVYNLVAGSRKAGERSGGAALGFGLLGSFFVVLLGNLEGLLESLHTRGLLSADFTRWLDVPGLADTPVTGAWYPGQSGGWWWWRASRVIQDRDLLGRPIGVSPITEFPFFSFLLGDNHPHVLALPFVLLAISLALNLLWFTLARRPAIKAPEDQQHEPAAWWNPVQTAFAGNWGLFGFYALALGSLGFLNTWDMPIYLALAALTFLVGAYVAEHRLNWDLLLQTGALLVGLLLASILLYLLFYLSFSSQAGGVLPYVFPPTRLPQYLVMFGVFVFILAWYLPAAWISAARRADTARPLGRLLRTWGVVVLAALSLFVLLLLLIAASDLGQQLLRGGLLDSNLKAVLGGLSPGEALAAALVARLLNPWLFLLLSFLLALSLANLLLRGGLENPAVEEQRAPEIFSFLLIFFGLALTLSVEFLFLRDSFGVRMNTVFKFYYQGWVLFALASAYAVWWLTDRLSPAVEERVLGPALRGVFILGTLLLIVAALVYPTYATYSRAGGFQGEPNLNGLSVMARLNPDDWSAVIWLRQTAAQRSDEMPPVILEAPGKSYDYEGRISAFTGLPAVLGWSLHEGQWRGNYTQQSLREPDIQTIFTTADGRTALDLLHKWNVDYVIVGAAEQNYIQRICAEGACNLSRALQKFNAVLEPVFQSGSLTIYAVPPPSAAPAMGTGLP